MVIRGRGRLRSIARRIASIAPGTAVIVGLGNAEDFRDELVQAGFDPGLVVGERVLPTVVGPVTRFNAEGREIVHRDQPKETVYRQVEWTREEWNGPYTQTVTDIVDIPYERYPRTFIEPPGAEIALARDPAGTLVVVSDPIEHDPADERRLLERVNLFGELFGQATLLTGDLEPYMRVRYRRLNWQLLPEGEQPWPDVERHARPIVERMAPNVAAVVKHRLRVLTERHAPDLTAVGRAGFAGYIVFGYRDKNLYILESLEYGNATYVFDQDWEALSQLSKAQIIRGDLHIERVVHRAGWESRINRLLA
jgi:hypothetical protein